MREEKDSFQSAAEVLCDDLREIVMRLPEARRSRINEIRLRAERPLALSDGSSTLFIDRSGRVLYTPGESACTVSGRQISDTFRRLCGYSVHSFQEDIKNGFITLRGGHRVGICGTAVLQEGRISTVTDISSLNIRIARQVAGAARELTERLYPFSGGIMIAGPPGSGKTTMLRDLALRLSVGSGCRIVRTAVIDERGEISGTFHGKAYNDVGMSDVLNGYPKGEGIIHALRALSPQVIICDEIGDSDDCRGVSQGFNAGALMIVSVHAGSIEDMKRRPVCDELIRTGAFSNIVLLDSPDRPCRIKEIIPLKRGEPLCTGSG